jgi:hypothetical protein
MTPDEHYRIATELALQVATKTLPETLNLEESRGDDFWETKRAWKAVDATLKLAQVHATLATIYRSTERLVEK